MAGTLMVMPAIGVLSGLLAVALHPLLTVGGLVVYGAWSVGGIVQSGFSWAFETIAESGLATQGAIVIEAAASSPGIALTGILTAWASILAASWILYHNVVAPPLDSESSWLEN